MSNYYSSHYSSRGSFWDNHGWWLKYAIPTVIIAAILALVFYPSYKHVDSVIVKVCGKESVSTSNNGHEYRVYTSAGTFVVKDHIINGARFSSADTYGKIQPGSVYEIKKFGWRIPIFSKFENIESATREPDDTAVTGSCDD